MRNKNTIYDLNLLDRFLFAQASEDIEFVELVLSIILDTDITLRDQPQPEREQRKRLTAKQIKLDVMATDTDDRVYDTEVQKKNTNNLPRRMRYYHSMIDTKLLPAGERDYNLLNDVYVIIIAPFDLFGDGLYKYTFRMTCDEKPGMALDDGTTTIFLNTRGTDPSGVSEELIELLKYFENSVSARPSEPHSDRLQTIRKKVDEIRRSEEIGVKYMLEWEEREELKEEAHAEGLAEGREEGLEQGREQGLEQGREEGLEQGKQEATMQMARNMLANGLPIETIVKCTGLTQEEIEIMEED